MVIHWISVRPVYVRKGIDADMISLVEKMNQGDIDALFLVNTNPVYHYPDSDRFVSGLKKVVTYRILILRG